jgi:uncharacterized membrane protein YfcA
MDDRRGHYPHYPTTDVCLVGWWLGGLVAWWPGGLVAWWLGAWCLMKMGEKRLCFR